MGSNPPNTQPGKSADCYGCMPGHTTEQADAEQACAPAELSGTETWAALPLDAWLDSWYRSDGTPKYQRPVARLLRALYGHLGAGTLWETHCDKAVREVGLAPIPNWPSCYFHAKLKYRVAFQGNQVVAQHWEMAMFQDMGSNPSNMQSGNSADCYGCVPGHTTERADTEQAYIPAE